MRALPVTFSAHLDRPLVECLAALDRWAGTGAAVPTPPDRGAPPLRYRVPWRGRPVGRRTLEVRVGQWAGPGTTHLELVPSRAMRPTARAMAQCRALLHELVAAAATGPKTSRS